ncbi:hypothetical protein EcE22_5328 [Escherichia coli E22]|nr:hypothetical protein EcE22_5328 [Escherichia coli E22]
MRISEKAAWAALSASIVSFFPTPATLHFIRSSYFQNGDSCIQQVAQQASAV